MKEKLSIKVHPNKVLIKITQAEWNDMFSIWITRADGKREQLFKDIEEEEGFEKRFRQNMSVGTVVGVGSLVKGVIKGDIAVIDYLVTGNSDALVGMHNGNRLITVDASTTYHNEDSTPMIDGRKTWRVGDFDVISPLLGIIRMGRLKAFSPYVFLEYINPTRMEADEKGLKRIITDDICKREIIGGPFGSIYMDGNTAILRESDLFFRTIDGKMLSVAFENDIIAVL